MKARLFWLCALVTIGSAFTSVGFSVAALSSSGDAQVNAMYAASRSLSLALASVVVVFARSRIGLMAVAFVMAMVQGADAVIGAIRHQPLKTFGPAFLALVTVAVLIPLWRCSHRTKQNQPMRHPRPNQSLELTATNDSFRPRAAI